MNRALRIGLLGFGRFGAALASVLEQHGHRWMGWDANVAVPRELSVTLRGMTPHKYAGLVTSAPPASVSRERVAKSDTGVVSVRVLR